jgi:hypothetical protein
MTVVGSIYWLGPYRGAGEFIVGSAVGNAELILQAPSNGFLEQIAKAESSLGTHKNTFNDKADCGIWQFTSTGLEATKDIQSHPQLTRAHYKIDKALGLDWRLVECDDLKYPLLGALAARLYLMTIPKSIPEGLKERAEYWKRYYNTNKGSGTVEYFIKVNEVREEGNGDRREET